MDYNSEENDLRRKETRKMTVWEDIAKQHGRFNEILKGTNQR